MKNGSYGTGCSLYVIIAVISMMAGYFLIGLMLNGVL